jgi:hypothetical protein
MIVLCVWLEQAILPSDLVPGVRLTGLGSLVCTAMTGLAHGSLKLVKIDHSCSLSRDTLPS